MKSGAKQCSLGFGAGSFSKSCGIGLVDESWNVRLVSAALMKGSHGAVVVNWLLRYILKPVIASSRPLPTPEPTESLNGGFSTLRGTFVGSSSYGNPTITTWDGVL